MVGDGKTLKVMFRSQKSNVMWRKPLFACNSWEPCTSITKAHRKQCTCDICSTFFGVTCVNSLLSAGSGWAHFLWPEYWRTQSYLVSAGEASHPSCLGLWPLLSLLPMLLCFSSHWQRPGSLTSLSSEAPPPLVDSDGTWGSESAFPCLPTLCWPHSSARRGWNGFFWDPGSPPARQLQLCSSANIWMLSPSVESVSFVLKQILKPWSSCLVYSFSDWTGHGLRSHVLWKQPVQVINHQAPGLMSL